MMRRLAAAVSVALIGAVPAGCGLVDPGPAGSGRVVTEERAVAAFDRILVEEGLDLALEIVSGAGQRVSVSYDDNLLASIGTTVTDGVLHIEILESFRVTGGGRLVTVTTGRLEVLTADSGADVRATGSVEDVEIEASGGASLDLSLLEARRITVKASGGAYLAVRASESVNGQASGGAEVLVLGDPASLDVATSGGARVVSE